MFELSKVYEYDNAESFFEFEYKIGKFFLSRYHKCGIDITLEDYSKKWHLKPCGQYIKVVEINQMPVIIGISDQQTYLYNYHEDSDQWLLNPISNTYRYLWHDQQGIYLRDQLHEKTAIYADTTIHESDHDFYTNKNKKWRFGTNISPHYPDITFDFQHVAARVLLIESTVYNNATYLHFFSSHGWQTYSTDGTVITNFITPHIIIQDQKFWVIDKNSTLHLLDTDIKHSDLNNMMTWWHNDYLYINARGYLHAWGSVKIHVSTRIFGFFDKFNIKWLSDQIQNYARFIFLCFNHCLPNTNLKYKALVPSPLILKYIIGENVKSICYCQTKQCKCWGAHKVVTV